MAHILHMLTLAAILTVFFALVFGDEGRRLRFGVKVGAALAGGALLAGLLMYPFS